LLHTIFTQKDQSVEPMAASLPIAFAIFANTCNGIIMDMIFLSRDDKNGLINIHPDAKRTIYNISKNLLSFLQFFVYAPIINRLRIPLMLEKRC
jgi:hypothetical protein